MTRQDWLGGDAADGQGGSARRRLAATIRVVAAITTLTLAAPGHLAWADPAEVESLIAQGNDLRRQGRDAQAVPLFKKAYDIDQTPRTAGQLGLVELAAGYSVEAAEHIGLALESPDHPWVASNRRSLEKMLAKARAAIGEVTVEGTPVGAAVSVNGRSVGTLPLATAVRVPAGRVVVTLSAAGYTSVERVLQVRRKQTQRLSISLDKSAGPSATTTQPLPLVQPPHAGAGEPPASSPSTSSGTASAVPPAVMPLPPAADSSTAPSAVTAEASAAPISEATTGLAASGSESGAMRSALRVGAWVAAGAAAGGLVTGYLFQRASNAAYDDFNNGCFNSNGVHVDPMNAAGKTMESCLAIDKTGSSDKTWSLVGYIGGGVLAATSAVLFWTSASPNSHAGALHAGLQCAPTLGGLLLCRGEF